MDSRPGKKSIRFSIDIWWQADQGMIHIASTDAGTENFHTTVNDKDGSIRCHKNLFMKLAQVLEAAGKDFPGYQHLQ